VRARSTIHAGIGGGVATPGAGSSERSTARPHTSAEVTIQDRPTWDSPASVNPPPTSECTPLNHTCSRVWPGPAFSLRSHMVGTNGARVSSMATAWRAWRTQELSVVSWNCQRRLMSRSGFHRDAGMPREPTVSHTPTKRRSGWGYEWR